MRGARSYGVATRGAILDPRIETFEAGRERGQSGCPADGVEIDVDEHRTPLDLVHPFEPDARSDEAPFLGAEQAYAQAARTSGCARRKPACQRERDRDACRVVDGAFAMGMA